MQSDVVLPKASVPAHVPADRVVDFDLYHPSGVEHDLHLAWKALHDGPDIVWTTSNGGHWIVTRADDMDFVLRNPDPFTSREVALPAGSKPAESKLIPLEADPPIQVEYRKLINPWFTPKEVNVKEEAIRTLAIELIEGLKPAGRCEFISAFALKLPLTIFLQLVDLPLSDREQLQAWDDVATRGKTQAIRWKAYEDIGAYLRRVLVERKANPGTDLFSRVISGSVQGRALTEEEIHSLCLILLLGGLDTVASMTGFFARFLAYHPEHRRELRDHPERSGNAVDELLRRFGISGLVRVVSRDTDYRGTHFKAEDRVYLPTWLYGLDDRKFKDPLTVDFSRGNVIHGSFGAGPHRCPGSFLARTELKIFLEEWVRRIPEFSIDPDQPPVIAPGMVNSVHSLHLVWDSSR